MHLVDSSSWIHMLRPDGDRKIRQRVEELLQAGQACWCPIIRLELWNGARGEHERRVLTDFESDLPELPIDQKVWEEAYQLARKARRHGITAPAVDLLIVACAHHHHVDLEHTDQHFDALLRL
jgi:predicted nucleic acid-binding protein